MELLLGGVAAVVSCCFTTPLEVTKIRMQLQGELQSRGKYAIHYRNVFHAAYTIGKKDGIFALQKGLAPACCYQFVMNGTRLGLYDLMEKQGFTKNKDGKVSSLYSALVGMMSGVIGGSLGSPFFLVKTHVQSLANESTIAVGHQHERRRMTVALKEIYKKFGIRGLYRGTSSTLTRITVSSSVQLASYSKALELARSEGSPIADGRWSTSIFASVVSGFLVSVAIAPLDIISTRFYNQPVDSRGKGILYRSVLDCAKKIFLKEDLRSFYKGWSANYFRLGPHTLLTLVFWEQLKHYYNEYELSKPTV